MSDHSALVALAAHKYVRLTTYRKDGTPVPTAVWLVRDGEQLAVLTGPETGKVKRIRHTPTVRVAPSDGRGQVRPGAADVEAVAELVTDPAEVSRIRGLVRDRYGFAYRMITFVHRLRGAATQDRVALRLTAA
jgi:uncharacterized protein